MGQSREMGTFFRSNAIGPPPPMVRDEVPDDQPAVDALLQAAFGRPDEAEAVAALRADAVPGSRSLVAVVSDHHAGESMAGLGTGEVVGYLRLTPAPVGEGEVLVLSPIAVLPARQRQGVGTYLVQFALEMEGDSGHHAVVVPDEGAFWDRFGFGPAEDSGLTSTRSRTLRVASSRSEHVQGVVELPAPIASLR